MKTITDQLIAEDGLFTPHDEGDWSTNEYKGDGFVSFNDAGLECEVGEFLFGLVRVLKPQYVVETGTHLGVGACYLGSALRANNRGKLDTIEFLPEIYRVASDRIGRMRLSGWVNCHLTDVADFTPSGRIQLLLLDTEPQTRFAEMARFVDYLDEGGFVFIHDLHRHMHQIPNEEHGFAWPYGKIPSKISQLVKSGHLRPIHFSTPRGLTGFYKTCSGDYKW